MHLSGRGLLFDMRYQVLLDDIDRILHTRLLARACIKHRFCFWLGGQQTFLNLFCDCCELDVLAEVCRGGGSGSRQWRVLRARSEGHRVLTPLRTGWRPAALSASLSSHSHIHNALKLTIIGRITPELRPTRQHSLLCRPCAQVVFRQNKSMREIWKSEVQPQKPVVFDPKLM